MMGKLGLNQELSKVMAAASSGAGLEGSLRDLVKSLEQAFGSAAGGSGAAAGSGAIPGAVEKLMYLSVLRGAMQKAAESKQFNLETQMNDLWVKLSQVRQHKSSDNALKLQQVIEKQSQVQQTISNIMKQFHDASMSVVRNLR
jgi:hypothetical protein